MLETRHAPFVPGERVRVRGGLWQVDGVREFPGCATLLLRGADAATFGTSRTVLLPFDRPSRQPRTAQPRVVSRRRGLRTVVELAAICHPYEGLRAAAAARIDLLGFQLEPALAICRGLGSRILLADEVGLGKTIQAGLILAELQTRDEANHTLIVVPSGIRDQWASELSAHFGFRPLVLDLAALAAASSEVPAGVNPWSIPGVRIVSIDFLKRPEVLQPLRELLWDVLVIDEAHHVTSSTDRGAAARILANRSRHVLLLTATPHSGEEREFESLCGIGAGEADVTPILMFRRTRAQVGYPHDRRVRVLAVRPSLDEARVHLLLDEYARDLWGVTALADAWRASELRLLLAVLYKRAFSSASSLAASLQRRLRLLEGGEAASAEVTQSPLPFDDDEEIDDREPAVLGTRGFSDTAHEVERLRTLAAAAERAAHDESKLRVVRALLRRTREPLIVFTEYRDTLLRIAEHISPQPLAVLHGGMTRRERRAAEQAFTGGHARVLVATDAAGEGLNLQRACRLVVSLELPWSPVRLEQRIGRVDRIGQRRRVHAIALLARDTSELRVLSRLAARASSARHSLGRVADPPAALAETEVLRALLGVGDTSEPPDPPRAPPPYRLVNLGDEGHAECRRLTIVRRLTACLGRATSIPGPVIARPPRRTTRSVGETGILVFVYRVRVRDGTRATLEDTLIPIAAPVSPALLRNLPKRRFKEVTDRFSETLAPEIDLLLKTAAGHRALQIHQLHHALLQRREAREIDLGRVMADAHADAARRLAQPSLFYRTTGDAVAEALGEHIDSVSSRQHLRLGRLTASRGVAVDPPELLVVLPW
ncbi:MAG: DEAD/DEAH box helicase [Acidobacteria bacterium]|nr:DEAD/DEAH box helicase [Acidobacteriota bacterium]